MSYETFYYNNRLLSRNKIFSHGCSISAVDYDTYIYDAWGNR